MLYTHTYACMYYYICVDLPGLVLKKGMNCQSVYDWDKRPPLAVS